MSEWEYRKIDLNQLARKTDDIDVLCDAGEEGWELVAILANNVAYLKRQVGESVPETTARGWTSSPTDRNSGGNGATVGTGYKAKVKYRDPETNETWSGRGLMASRLKQGHSSPNCSKVIIGRSYSDRESALLAVKKIFFWSSATRVTS